MYCQQWGIDYLIFRFFNVYGEGQNPQYAGVITAFNVAAQKKEPLIVYGDENCTTHESARWQRVGKLVSDCSNRTREGRIKLTNDSSHILIQHLREKYPVLPVVCPVYKDIDLIYSSASLTHAKRNNCISIDRIDASKGYVVDNVQIISHKANRKKTAALEEKMNFLIL